MCKSNDGERVDNIVHDVFPSYGSGLRRGVMDASSGGERVMVSQPTTS